ncbi:hypothetical protein CLAIMM_12506 [Cladophialophora immunda]|nr:hypothetical protein CLAIMM_12506 [Cladophialophora immunda]
MKNFYSICKDKKSWLRSRKYRPQILKGTPFIKPQRVELAQLRCPNPPGETLLLRKSSLLKHSLGISRQKTDSAEHPQLHPNTSLRTSPGYRPDKAVRGRGLREEEIHFIEQALKRRLSDSSLDPRASHRSPECYPATDRPRIQVKASARSISIIIPEGVKLPVVATIESAGSFEFETQMSTSNDREASKSSSTAGFDPNTREMSRRQETLSEQTATEAIRASENQEIIAGLGLPFLARVSKGRLNVSEASISAPQSADVSASGQVFIPPHERSPEEVPDPLHHHSREAEVKPRGDHETSEPLKEPREVLSSQAITEPALDPAGPADTASPESERELKAEEADPSSEEPASTSVTKSENPFDPVAAISSEVDDPRPFSIPEIRIHRPSGTVMSDSPGAADTNSSSMSPTTVQTAKEQSPTTTPLKAVSNPITAVLELSPLPVDPTSATNAVPIDAVASTLPVSVSVLPVAGKIGKRKRVIQKARRVIVRKHLLAIILGRDLASVVHPQLNAAGKPVPDVPLPLDGASDLIRNYGRRNRCKRATQQERLNQKIAGARFHVGVEDIQRCSSCRGLKGTFNLRRYDRLQLQRTRPTVGVIERHARSRAQVAAFKCQCSNPLLGAGGQRAATDSALPTAPEHLQAHGINGHPLPGAVGDTQR